MFIIITSILLFIAVTTSLTCVTIVNITVDRYMKQAKEYEAEIECLKAEIERLKAAMENTTSKDK